MALKIEMGIGWVPHPTKPGHLQSANPGDYAREIERLRASLDQIITVCNDNAPPQCDAHMALDFVRQVAIQAKSG